jgi:glutamate racemase
MKIGVFDSGLGGLVILKSLRAALPQYDFVYLGDTQREPYGNRSQEAIYEFTQQGVEYLFKKQNCALVVLACNTASSQALRKLQQKYMPAHFPNRKILGVLIPMAEEVGEHYSKVGVLATEATISSQAVIRQFHRLHPKVTVIPQAAPLLVPMIVNGGLPFIEPVLRYYVAPLVKARVDVIALYCTHYGIIKKDLQKIVGKNIRIIAQEDVVPTKLQKYLERHPEIDKKLSKHRSCIIFLTDVTKSYSQTVGKWFGRVPVTVARI